MKIVAVLCLFISIQAHAMWPQDIPSDVRVSSTYESPQGLRPLTGQGVYVAYGKYSKNRVTKFKRHFVITAAHLSQGRNVSIKLNGETVNVIGRISNSNADVELFEIEAPKLAAPLAIWAPETKAFVNGFFELKKKLYSLSSDATAYAFPIGNTIGDIDVEGMLFGRTTSNRPPYIALQSTPPRAMSFDAIAANPKVKRTVIRNAIGQIVFQASIVPGMSGLPTFIFMANIDGIAIDALVGVVSQYARYEAVSYATGPDSIESLFDNYVRLKIRGELIANHRGLKTKTLWQHDGFSTYRSVYNIETNEELIKEASLSQGTAGSGTGGDGGSGTGGDGGSGTGGDGGINGIRKNDLTPQSYRWKEIYLSGINYFGRQVAAFRIIPASGEPLLLKANWVSANFVSFLPLNYRIEAITSVDAATDASSSAIDITHINIPVQSNTAQTVEIIRKSEKNQ